MEKKKWKKMVGNRKITTSLKATPVQPKQNIELYY